MGRRSRGAGIAAMLLLWVGGSAFGFRTLLDYSLTPGLRADTLPSWPEQSAITASAHVPTLVLFLHPKCPCSRASVEEFDRIMAQTGGKVRAFAVFAQPKGWSAKETQSALWKRVSRIPGVQLVLDPDGKEADRFGVLTSGHVLAYDTRGRKVFTGGITPSRGHEGDNAGAESVVRFVRDGKTDFPETRVYGCSLKNQKGGDKT